ncbi:death domain-containing protein CRADD [Lingula anatina]|uniref:Death domain-containing protein CRADD n=1 Tax=Lingula anatina TaxID=7574 RepID=A0A1S3ILY6_LINAN|nr:death domain-containing protein CRADD [Lingula anatina]XP_013399255.1 death domain-containing protein CRADD [Lingula anatina]|eukprot:XP_013399254.1 death domain-containing protein CRADD [Lingula anatina]
MNETERFILRKNRVAIVQDLRVSDILPFLIQEGALSDDDAERITIQATARDRACALLDILTCRGPKAYRLFIESLRENYYWLVRALEDTDLTELKEKERLRNMYMTPEELPKEKCEVLNHKTLQLTVKYYGNLLGWKSLARELGLEESDIADIEYRNSRNLKEQVYQMLTTWRERKGREASVDGLITALRGLNQNRCADVLEGKGSTLN